MEFKEFLMKEYLISKKSAQDYVGRFNGIIAKGLYKGESEISTQMKETIEDAFPDSKAHYVLALERYIEFQNKKTRRLN